MKVRNVGNTEWIRSGSGKAVSRTVSWVKAPEGRGGKAERAGTVVLGAVFAGYTAVDLGFPAGPLLVLAAFLTVCAWLHLDPRAKRGGTAEKQPVAAPEQEPAVPGPVVSLTKEVSRDETPESHDGTDDPDIVESPPSTVEQAVTCDDVVDTEEVPDAVEVVDPHLSVYADEPAVAHAQVQEETPAQEPEPAVEQQWNTSEPMTNVDLLSSAVPQQDAEAIHGGTPGVPARDGEAADPDWYITYLLRRTGSATEQAEEAPPVRTGTPDDTQDVDEMRRKIREAEEHERLMMYKDHLDGMSVRTISTKYGKPVSTTHRWLNLTAQESRERLGSGEYLDETGT